jgi:predicted dienelactone hydrolase
MRLFEILLSGLFAIRFVLPLFKIKRQWLDWLSLGTLGVTALQLGLEGYRWQLIPLYAISLGMAVFAVLRIRHKSESDAPAKGSAIKTLAGLVVLGIAILPAILLPVPRTPGPTGPYLVGTVTLYWVDESRQELYAGLSGQPRRLMVQIWYPAEPESGAETAFWMEHVDQFGPAMSAYLGLPTFFLDHVRYSKSHAYKEAPIASGNDQYPLLLFSHGWNGFRSQNTYQAEMLASHGYVVVAPDHTYGAVVTVFPNGEAAFNNPEALPADMGYSEAEFMVAANLLGQQWAGDLSFILDYLENLQPDDAADFLIDRLDFEHVGAFGHSTGGGATIEFCARDARCKAILDMDPYMDPVSEWILVDGISQPYLAMFSESLHYGGDRFNQFYGQLQGEKHRFSITGTRHFDFTDLPAFSPVASYIGLKGPLNGRRVLQIITDYTLAFFDQYLKGESGALKRVETFPEVRWISED